MPDVSGASSRRSWTEARVRPGGVRAGSRPHHVMQMARNLKLVNCLFLDFSVYIFGPQLHTGNWTVDGGGGGD